MPKKQTKIRNATPLEVDGIKFRSKLEVYCYRALVEAGIEYEYEAHRFNLVDKFEYTNDSVELVKKKGLKTYGVASNSIRAITYTPDFVNTQDRWIIECKGYPNDTFSLKWKIFKSYIVSNNLQYDLYVPRNRKHIDETIKLIKSKNESIKTRT